MSLNLSALLKKPPQRPTFQTPFKTPSQSSSSSSFKLPPLKLPSSNKKRPSASQSSGDGDFALNPKKIPRPAEDENQVSQERSLSLSEGSQESLDLPSPIQSVFKMGSNLYSPTESVTPLGSRSLSPTESVTPLGSRSLSPTECVTPLGSRSPSPTESVTPLGSRSPSSIEGVTPLGSRAPSPIEGVTPLGSRFPSPIEGVSELGSKTGSLVDLMTPQNRGEGVTERESGNTTHVSETPSPLHMSNLGQAEQTEEQRNQIIGRANFDLDLDDLDGDFDIKPLSPEKEKCPVELNDIDMDVVDLPDDTEEDYLPTTQAEVQVDEPFSSEFESKSSPSPELTSTTWGLNLLRNRSLTTSNPGSQKPQTSTANPVSQNPQASTSNPVSKNLQASTSNPRSHNLRPSTNFSVENIEQSFKQYDHLFAKKAPGQRSIFSPRTPGSGGPRQSNPGPSTAVGGGDTEGEPEEGEEKILSIFFTANNLGAALYNRETSKLELLKDIPDDPDSFEILGTLIHQVSADFVLVSTRQDDSLIEFLKQIYQPTGSSNTTTNTTVNSSTAEEGQDSEDRPLPPEIVLRPGMDFGLNSSERRLKQLRVPGNGGKPRNKEEQGLQVTANIDFGCICMVRAAGALMKYIDKNYVSSHSEDGDINILFINYISLGPILTLDYASLEGLQVFHTVTTQSGSTAGSWNKRREGLSMFTLFNRCNSVIGTRLLKRILKSPSADLRVIEERQHDVQFFTRNAQTQFVISLCRSIKKIKNFHRLTKKLCYTQVSVSDWLGVFRTLTGIIEISVLADNCPAEVHLLRVIQGQMEDIVFSLRDVMDQIIDWPKSQTDGTLRIKAGVDAGLDERRRFHSGLSDLLQQVAREERHSVPSFVYKISVVFLPHIGFLIALPYNELLEQKGVDYKHLPNLDYVFENDDILYYRNDRMRHLDQTLGDVAADIIMIESNICLRLSESILNNRSMLERIVTSIGHLDCIMSMALVGRDFNWVRPRVVKTGDLKIKGGRHPLQELTLPHHFIGNDTTMGRTGGKAHLLTGPNSSGKSIYMKQVGLIVYLAQLGCFVPAQDAEIPIVDKIFTRIVTYDAVSLGISAFFCDLGQLSFALNNFTPRSLVLVDEFGKGTLPEDGATLLAAAVEFVSELGQRAPYSIFSTHFHELSEMLGTPPGLTYFHMAANKTDQGIVYLYKLEPGICHYSYANEVARAAYVKKHVVERMEDIVKTGKFDLLPKISNKRKIHDILRSLTGLDMEDQLHLYIFMENLKKLKI